MFFNLSIDLFVNNILIDRLINSYNNTFFDSFVNLFVASRQYRGRDEKGAPRRLVSLVRVQDKVDRRWWSTAKNARGAGGHRGTPLAT